MKLFFYNFFHFDDSYFFFCFVSFAFNLISKAVRWITQLHSRKLKKMRREAFGSFLSVMRLLWKRLFISFGFYFEHQTWITKNCHVKYSTQKIYNLFFFFADFFCIIRSFHRKEVWFSCHGKDFECSFFCVCIYFG